MKAKKINPHQHKKKHSFLLLEALLAIILMSIALFVVIHPFVSCFKEEIKMLKKVDAQRIADLLYLDIIQSIIAGKEPLNEGSFSINAPLVFAIDGSQDYIKGLYVIKALKKTQKDKTNFYSVTIIFFNHGEDLSFTYPLML
jgi:hypothetical protein